MRQVLEPSHDHVETPVISVIIPGQFHDQEIESFVHRTAAVLDGVASFEIIIVCASKTDDTTCSCKHAQYQYSDCNGDLTEMLVQGATNARGDVVVVLDDLTHPPESIPQLLQPILDDSSDIVIGYAAHDEQHPSALYKRLLARLRHVLATPFVDVQHPFSGFFAARKHSYRSLSNGDTESHLLLSLLAVQPESTRIAEVLIASLNKSDATCSFKLQRVIPFLQHLGSLAGATATSGSAIRFGIVGLLGVCVDITVFFLFTNLGFSIGTSHISSFFAATIFNYILNDTWTFHKPNSNSPTKLTATRYGTYLLVCLAALFVRGGILSTGLEFGFHPILSVILAIAFATGVNFFGSSLFVFKQTKNIRSSIQIRIAAVAIIFYSIALRISYFASIDLLPEEAYYWNYAQHLDYGYLDHPPMISWLIALSTSMFGDSEVAIRIPAFACWFIVFGFIGALTNRIAGRSAAFAAGALLAIFPFFMLSGFIATPDSPLMACWAASLYFLHLAIVDRKNSAWIGFGIAIGLGMLSKYTIALLGISALSMMCLDKDTRQCFRSPYPYIGAIVAFLIFSPVVIWNAQHEWASFAFQSLRRLNQTPEFGLHLLIGSWVLLLTPVGIASALRALLFRSRERCSIEGKSRLLLSIAALVPLIVFVVFSIQHEPKLNWTGPLWLALFPLLVLDFVPAINSISKYRKTHKFPINWKLTFFGSLLLFGVGFHFLALGIPGVGYAKGMPTPVAWEEFGATVANIEIELENQYQTSPTLIGMDHYFIVSELAYYRATLGSSSRDPSEVLASTTTRHLFGLSGLMFETWTPAKNFLGDTCLLVGDRFDSMPDRYLTKFFDELTEIETVTIRKNEHEIYTFYWRVGIGYRPHQ